jgi:hypothetical protein
MTSELRQQNFTGTQYLQGTTLYNEYTDILLLQNTHTHLPDKEYYNPNDQNMSTLNHFNHCCYKL